MSLLVLHQIELMQAEMSAEPAPQSLTRAIALGLAVVTIVFPAYAQAAAF